jgi:hypothetical protein
MCVGALKEGLREMKDRKTKHENYRNGKQKLLNSFLNLLGVGLVLQTKKGQGRGAILWKSL